MMGMNTDSPNPASVGAVFSSMRSKLAREVSGSAMLLELLERLNRMQACHDCAEEFKVRLMNLSSKRKNTCMW